MPTTTKWGLRSPAAGDAVNVPLDMQELAEDTENLGLPLVGTFAGKPTAATAKSGRTYWCTDTGQYLVSDGTNWQEAVMVPAGTADIGDDIVTEEKLSDALASKWGISKSGIVKRGKCIIPGEQSTTSTTYTTLTTPDRVQNIVMPTDGLLFVMYDSIYRGTHATGAIAFGDAAIFIGSNQLAVADGDGPPALDSAVPGAAGSTTATGDSRIGTAHNGGGLYSGTAQTNAALDCSNVTTGMVAAGNGGIVPIWVAAGTYTVSVQFKVRTGCTLFMKERNLWVWTREL